MLHLGKRRSKPGSAPGTLVAPAERVAAEMRIEVFDYEECRTAVTSHRPVLTLSGAILEAWTHTAGQGRWRGGRVRAPSSRWSMRRSCRWSG